MGFDKATLVLDGTPLWQRQIATLRETHPAELFISGRVDGPYANSGLRIVPDEIQGRGPLGGIATILRAARHPLALVLAVDLPMMTSAWLRLLLGTGASIPVLHGEFEPLAAVYPAEAGALATRLLEEGRNSMREFARKLVSVGLAQAVQVRSEDAGLFRNVNTPGDLASLSR
jgi:molybdenum cofactor guanylyltransferase